jgi:hypothetical protein
MFLFWFIFLFDFIIQHYLFFKKIGFMVIFNIFSLGLSRLHYMRRRFNGLTRTCSPFIAHIICLYIMLTWVDLHQFFLSIFFIQFHPSILISWKLNNIVFLFLKKVENLIIFLIYFLLLSLPIFFIIWLKWNLFI